MPPLRVLTRFVRNLRCLRVPQQSKIPRLPSLHTRLTGPILRHQQCASANPIPVLWMFAKGFLGLHIIFAYIVEIASTDGISMIPAIPHSYVSHPKLLISKLHRRGRGVKVGDIVIFAHPMLPKAFGAKRIVGMPGDFVCVRTPGKLVADAENRDVVGGEVTWEMIQVPEGHCWLAGDNLEWSRDSRTFGPVPLALVKGRALAVLWPWPDRKWFKSGQAVQDAGGGHDLVGIWR